MHLFFRAVVLAGFTALNFYAHSQTVRIPEGQFEGHLIDAEKLAFFIAEEFDSL